MLKPVLLILALNGFVGVTANYIYTYINTIIIKQATYERRIDYLSEKVCKLQKQVNDMQIVIKRQDQMKEELHTKIEEIISSQYEVI